jgi:serine/threonine protein kinase
MTAPSPIPPIVDSYRLRIARKIATGGMGIVYEALQCGSDGFEKRVAIKTILSELAREKEFTDMFVGEAKLVADLIHQNIVQVYQFGRLEDTFYISMEYVRGVNLEGFMDEHIRRKQKIPVDIAAFIAAKICLGLHYAHEKTDSDGNNVQIVHRDISPKNIMIDDQGVVKITDFGIAKAAHVMRDQEGEVLLGKLQYMSPEQARFEKTDRRSDIFSLGIVMYEMLAGENIFNDYETRTTLENVCRKPIPPISEFRNDVPPELELFMSKALQRERDKRYQTAAEFAHDLQMNFLYRGRQGPTYQTMLAYLRSIYPNFGKGAGANPGA